MKVVFLSTELTPHQIPFCNSLNDLADTFYFMQFSHQKASWESKGQTICAADYSYLRFYHTDKEFCDAEIISADVVILGGVDLSVVQKRLQAGKLVFVYLERFYKNGISLKNAFRAVIGTFLHHGRFQKYHPYLLCASGYCAGDAAIFGNYRSRTLKWGYFPENRITDPDALITEKTENTIIWVGRLIDWKHPDDMLLAAKQLQDQGYRFRLMIYGGGEMHTALQTMVQQYGLQNCVCLCGNVPNEKVRQAMRESSIFVSTSDYGEGWGCVINEAMNDGCAVIASHAVGAVPFLIQDGENGIIYESGNVDQLTAACARLLNDPALCRQIGRNAYMTIDTKWNAQTAAEQLLRSCQKILEKQQNPFEETGPCSYAQPIPQKTMYKRVKK